MRALLTTLFLVLTVASELTAQAQGQESANALGERLDDGLADADGFARVFVRMDDQLFAKGGDYARFCAAQAEETRRLELRETVIEELRGKAAASRKGLAPKLDSLVKQGAVRRVQHYWIVNGFACEATADACRELAGREGVVFVYRQRYRRQHRRAAGRSFERDADLDELYAGLLKRPAEGPFSAEGLEVPWNLKAVGADRAWADHGVTGSGVLVAVLDDGVMSVPALVPALWRHGDETLNGKDDDGNGFVDDVFGYDFAEDTPYAVSPSGHRHGTLCASVIASRPFGGDVGIATSVAPRARVMALVGNGQLRAYEYALRNGADVLSMSYTFEPVEMGHYRGLFRTAHEHLAAAGIVAVGGAGNYAESRPAGTQIGSPKDIPCVLAAAGVGPSLEITAFSSRGPVSWEGIRFFGDEPELGPAIHKPDLTCCNSGFPMWTLREVWTGKRANRIREVVREDDAGYILAKGPRGNSFAGPHAAGVAALVLEANPDLTAWRVQEILRTTARDMGEPGHDVASGAGMIQAHAAVAAALAAKDPAGDGR